MSASTVFYKFGNSALRFQTLKHSKSNAFCTSKTTKVAITAASNTPSFLLAAFSFKINVLLSILLFCLTSSTVNAYKETNHLLKVT